MYDIAVTGWKGMDHGSEIREFLTSRRVSGLRRSGAAQFAGASVEYEQVHADAANRRTHYAQFSHLGPPDVRPSPLGNEPASWADT
ncbi:hypothetical protein [Streptomyces mirabilis]|uniref:hypothetical protein n=1 Tax=Streptomyces mirabilis TaxID=68239 RepID=UPI0007658FDB